MKNRRIRETWRDGVLVHAQSLETFSELKIHSEEGLKGSKYSVQIR